MLIYSYFNVVCVSVSSPHLKMVMLVKYAFL